MACTLCNYETGPGVLPGPSDHEAWCPAFMVGPVDIEGQLELGSGQDDTTTVCAVCGDPVTAGELERLALDVDFVEHGDRGHLIRLDPVGRRRERLEARAEKRQQWAASRDAAGDAAHRRVREIADRIPFGQPILVGHHSERGARADQRRIENGMRSACDNWNMADRHEEKAEGLERQLRTSVYSDDVDAVEKLRAKVEQLEARRDRVKRYNASCRKGSPDASILTEREREEIVSLQRFAYIRESDGRYPAYVLTNMGAEIRRCRQRLEEIRQGQATLAAGGRGRGRPMSARFSSSCAECGKTIEKGAPIVYYRLVREAVHQGCDA